MYFLQQVPLAMNRFHDCHVFQIFNLHSVVCFIQLLWILPQVHVAMYTVHCTLYRCHNFHVFQIFTSIMLSVYILCGRFGGTDQLPVAVSDLPWEVCKPLFTAAKATQHQNQRCQLLATKLFHYFHIRAKNYLY